MNCVVFEAPGCDTLRLRLYERDGALAYHEPSGAFTQKGRPQTSLCRPGQDGKFYFDVARHFLKPVPAGNYRIEADYGIKIYFTVSYSADGVLEVTNQATTLEGVKRTPQVRSGRAIELD